MNINHDKLAKRSLSMLESLSNDIKVAKNETQSNGYYQVFSKAAVSKFPKLSKAIVDKTVSEMEENGYIFQKQTAGSTQKYAMSLQNVIDIYNYRKVPKYKDKYKEALTIFIGNLKGGVSKTVSTVSLAHSLRSHEQLIHHDLKILVIDLDPQSSATMFLNHEYSIGNVEATAAQAMLNNLSTEELLNEFIIESTIAGVDVIPASIEDAFIASKWKELCNEYLPDNKIYEALKHNIINKLKSHYDFIFIDSGPHLDAFLMNALTATDMIFTPIPPAQVDFHSTLKYLSRLPELFSLIEAEGSAPNVSAHIGFMSKLAKKSDHNICHSLAKEIFGGDMLDATMPRLDAFERCGESFDTVISANPKNYIGSAEALKKARLATENFAKAIFDRIEFIRAN